MYVTHAGILDTSGIDADMFAVCSHGLASLRSAGPPRAPPSEGGSEPPFGRPVRTVGLRVKMFYEQCILLARRASPPDPLIKF